MNRLGLIAVGLFCAGLLIAAPTIIAKWVLIFTPLCAH